MVNRAAVAFFSFCFPFACFGQQSAVESIKPDPCRHGSESSPFNPIGFHDNCSVKPMRDCEARSTPCALAVNAEDGWPAPRAQSSSIQPASGKPEGPHLIELTAANWRPLTVREKRSLFPHDLLHWETHVSLILDAGFSQAIGDRSYLGGGGAGFARRYGLNIADELNFTFFNVYLFPDLFHEDPRYIPRDHGGTGARLGYALTRTVLTRADSGGSEINRSKILGTIVATSLSSGYYAATGARVSAGGNFASIGINLASDAAFDVLKEFWPDFARKIKMNIWIRNLVRSALRDSIRVS